MTEAMVGTGCCKSGPVSGHLSLQRRGYAVGQSIPFRASIDNKSSRKMNVRVVLSQVCEYFRCYSGKNVKCTIARLVFVSLKLVTLFRFRVSDFTNNSWGGWEGGGGRGGGR